jgi:hypothetical protein
MKNLSEIVLVSLVVIGCMAAVAATSDTGVEAGGSGSSGLPPVTAKVPESPSLLPPPASAEQDPIGAIETLVRDIRAGNWRYAAAGLLALAMLALARVRDKVAWFRGDRGGAILVAVLALAGALSTSLATETAIDWRMFLAAAGVMWTAVGGVTWAKRLIRPKDTADPGNRSAAGSA